MSRTHRFRAIPTFGRDTIRRFANNVSEMKKLAARDFEDLLQVCHHCVLQFTVCYKLNYMPVRHASV
jgi:hypothetical protein